MKHQQVKDISNLYNSIYEEKSEEQLIAEFAADYFCEYGLNEDGIDILIEDVGLDNFIEFVYALSEDCEHLLEERSARRRTGGKSYEEVKAEIDAKEAAKAKAKARKKEESESETKSADTEAKEKQSEKRPVRDSIAKHILRGMERHNRAMDLAKKTIATAKKAASVAAEGERRAAHHIRKHGLKSLANEEAIISRFRQIIDERYRDEPLWGPGSKTPDGKPSPTMRKPRTAPDRPEPLWGKGSKTPDGKPSPTMRKPKPAPDRDEPLW